MPLNSGSPAGPDDLITPGCTGIRRCGAPSKSPPDHSGAACIHRLHVRSGAVRPDLQEYPKGGIFRCGRTDDADWKASADIVQTRTGIKVPAAGGIAAEGKWVWPQSRQGWRVHARTACGGRGVQARMRPEASSAMESPMRHAWPYNSPNLHIFRITPATRHRLPAASWPQSRCPSRARMRRTTRRTSSRARLRCRTSWPESRAVPARCS